jgi:hypothetical protein
MGLFRRRVAEENLFDSQQVDLIGITPDGQSVLLVVVADKPWSGSDSQIMSLQVKVQTYVSFALDGQLVQQYPRTKGLPWQVVIHTQTGPPDERTSAVLAELAERLPAYGGQLHIRESFEAGFD